MPSAMLSVPAPAQPRWVVHKYGGTSVGKCLEAIARNIVPAACPGPGARVAVVCSARSGDTKARGTTNLLLQAAAQALAPRSADPASVSASAPPSPPAEQHPIPSASSPTPAPSFEPTVALILADHLQAARLHIHDPERLAQLEAGLRDDCARLREILLAARVIDEISARTKDAILSLGERMSCRIVAAALNDAGTPATLITLESVVDPALAPPAHSGGALDHAFFQQIAQRLGRLLRAVPAGSVPVVTGHFGPVPGVILDQVGRGYTDLCAALCAVGVRADELQIWKEVDGVFTSDPRKVLSARLLPTISPEEAAELTHYGSEVIHSFTMEQAIREAIPIRIKNVMNPQGSGTVIVPTQEEDHGVDGHVAQPETPVASGVNTPLAPLSPALDPTKAKKRRLPTAVTIKDDIVVLNVHSNRKTVAPDFYARIFSVLDRYAVPVDLIATSKMHISMAVNASHRHLLAVRDELGALGTVSVLRDIALVSLIGKEMRHLIGTAGKMFTTLADGGINIELISQGASEISISVAVHKAHGLRAINLIHSAVLEVPPPPALGSFGRSFF